VCWFENPLLSSNCAADQRQPQLVFHHWSTDNKKDQRPERSETNLFKAWMLYSVPHEASFGKHDAVDDENKKQKQKKQKKTV